MQVRKKEDLKQDRGIGNLIEDLSMRTIIKKPKLTERSLMMLAYLLLNIRDVKSNYINLKDLFKIKRLKENKFTKKDISRELNTLMWYGMIYQPQKEIISLQPWALNLGGNEINK